MSLLRELIREELIKILREEVNREIKEVFREEMGRSNKEKVKKSKKRTYKWRPRIERERIKSAILSLLKDSKNGVTTHEVTLHLQKMGFDVDVNYISSLLFRLAREGIIEKREVKEEERDEIEERVGRISNGKVNLWFLKRDIQIPFEEQEKLLNQRGKGKWMKIEG